MTINMTLREHQTRAMDMLREALRAGKRRPMLQAPTGFGKTVIAAEMMDKARAKGNKVVFVVPRLELIGQTIDRFTANGITEIGVIQAQHRLTDSTKPIQIASVQTIASRNNMPDNIQLAVIDEAHIWNKVFGKFEGRGPARKVSGWFAEAPYPIIGLSATPWAKGLGLAYDALVKPTNIKELIDGGFLSPFVVYAPTHPDLTAVKTTETAIGEDYQEASLAEVMCGRQLVADVVETWIRLGENRSTLCFAVNRAHAMFLHQQFVARGVACAYVDCETPEKDSERNGEFVEGRRSIRERFAASDIKVVCNVDVLGIGVDWDVRCMILARPTKSVIRHVQTVGRGLRTAEGKDHVLILDHGDSHLRLGFVSDIDMYGMHTGSRSVKLLTKRVPMPRECKECHQLVPAGTRKCPACGHERNVTPAEIFTTKGKLGVFTGWQLSEEKREKRKANRDWTVEDKAQFYGELVYYGQVYGYKQGWAAMKYRERFDVWPNDPRVRYATPIPPTVDTMSWIKSQFIRYQHRKRGQADYRAVRG